MRTFDMQKRRIFYATLAAVALSLFGCNGGGGGEATPAVTGGQILLRPLWPGDLLPGEPLQFLIEAKNLPGVFQSSFRIIYDSTRLRYTGFQPGSFWVGDSDTAACRHILSSVRDFTNSGTLLVVISRPGAQCGNTDKINGEMGRITMTAVQPLSSSTGLARFTSDPSRLLVRNASGVFLTLGQHSDQQLSYTPASP